MRTSTCYAALICLTFWGALPAAQAEIASEEEAWIVAENYVQLIINRKGDWGGASVANVSAIVPFTRNGRTLGYFCYVEPRGFVLASLCQELTPVKAYSASSTLDPDSEEGPADVHKSRMLRTIEYIESETGKPIDELTSKDWDALVETDYRPAWSTLTDVDFDATQYRTKGRSRSVGMNYQEGETLLDSRWHQRPPYNDQCPDLGCDWSGWPYYGYNTNARVGCVATAGVQILRYWCWPPCSAAGEYVDRYHWTNMPGEVDIYSPQDQIDCVAAASYAVAVAVDMDFGCARSGAYTEDMEQVFENRRYDNDCNVKYRDDYSGDDWFNMVIAQFNLNRPVQYRVEGHSIAGDGWQIIDVGGVPTKQYHFVYGWFDGHDDWHDIDDIHLGGYNEEWMVRTIVPDVDLGAELSGTYPVPSDPGEHFDKPVRYFDQDTSGVLAEFEAGQTFQYVRPGLHIQHTGSGSDAITFNGTPSEVTEFYHGAPFGEVRIRISDGAIKMMNGGEICLHKPAVRR